MVMVTTMVAMMVMKNDGDGDDDGDSDDDGCDDDDK
jgi:hypothetical protein